MFHLGRKTLQKTINYDRVDKKKSRIKDVLLLRIDLICYRRPESFYRQLALYSGKNVTQTIIFDRSNDDL